MRVEDTLPREVDFTSATVANGAGTCVKEEVPPPTPEDEPGERVVCDLGTIRPNAPQPVVVHIEVTVKRETAHNTVIENTATVSSFTSDPDMSDNSDTEQTTVIGIADLSIVKTSDADVYKPSSTIQYTITVTNAGPSDAVNVVVIDHLPATKQAIYQFDTAGCTKSGLTLTCNLGTIQAGASKSFNVYVTVKGKKDRVTNIVDVSSDNVDPDISHNSSTREVLVKST